MVAFQKITRYVLIGSFVVSFARVAVGIHWPMDIVGAFVLSLIG